MAYWYWQLYLHQCLYYRVEAYIDYRKKAGNIQQEMEDLIGKVNK